MTAADAVARRECTSADARCRAVVELAETNENMLLNRVKLAEAGTALQEENVADVRSEASRAAAQRRNDA